MGSNTFSFTELSLDDNQLNIINDLSLGVRLSEGLTPGGPLTEDAVERGLSAVTKISDEFGLRNKPLRVVATAALRLTADPSPFTEPAGKILGVEVEIITGQEEALLTCRGAPLGIREGGPWIVADIGGQSTEIGWQREDGAWEVRSLALGVVNLTERFIASDPPRDEEMDALVQEIRQKLTVEIPTPLAGRLLGVAGTATTLGMMNLGIKTWQRDAVHGLELTAERVCYWKQAMTSISTAERTQRFGVRPARADVFPAGICIQDEILSHLGLDTFTISANGLRVGAALSILD